MGAPKVKQYITDGNGRTKAVIVPIDQYEKLIEDIHDLAVTAERRDEETVSLNKMKERLKKNGLL